jgi:hypothetical protein
MADCEKLYVIRWHGIVAQKRSAASGALKFGHRPFDHCAEMAF